MSSVAKGVAADLLSVVEVLDWRRGDGREWGCPTWFVRGIAYDRRGDKWTMILGNPPTRLKHQ